MTVCLSHSGVSVQSSDRPSDTLLAATVDGVFILERTSGGSWNQIGHGLAGHHVCSLAIEPSTGALVAGTHDAGVAISEDGGSSWTFRNEGLASLNIFSVATSLEDGQVRLYAGTEPAHIYVSEDFGASWSELEGLRSAPNLADWTFPPPPHEAHVKHISFDPSNPRRIYACVEQGELLRSEDGGKTWQDLLGPAGIVKEMEGDAHRVIIRPSRPGELYMPTGFGLYQSKDDGKSWNHHNDLIPWIGYPDPMVYDPNREDVLFVAGGKQNPGHWIAQKNANASVARSRDGGKTWELASASLPDDMNASIEAMALEGGEGYCAVYLGTTDGEIYCSEDDGESWTRIADGLPSISKGLHHLLAKGLIGGPPPPGMEGMPPPR